MARDHDKIRSPIINHTIMSETTDDRIIVWFDIDNTLYSASTRISQAMGTRIHDYFVGLGISHEEASDLHHKYYLQYGLALRGLTRHHDVDPLDFDAKCDGSLPLEDMIEYDPSLRKLLEDIDCSKVRVWALTNAYRKHAERVLRILKLDDLVEGLVYCDYVAKDFVCKPEPEFYQMAMKQANVSDPSKCYFIDDNRNNVDAAHEQGWSHCVHFCEKGLETMEGGWIRDIDDAREPGAVDNGVIDVTTLEELRKTLLPHQEMHHSVMDYKARYPQPFTLAEATALDVSIISEEISRLQNSVKYLRETQEVLKVALASAEPPDAEIAEAFEDNQVVIGSQEERISILKMAITEKGFFTGSHYDPMMPVSQPLITRPDPADTTIGTTLSDVEEDGVYL